MPFWAIRSKLGEIKTQRREVEHAQLILKKKNHNKNKQEGENKEQRLDALTYDLTRDLD